MDSAARHRGVSRGREPARRAPPSADLVVRFTRTSPTRHRLEFVRPDGTREACTLETRSCLVHDLVHFAVEAEAGLRRSFYGLIAGGAAYATLADATNAVGEAELLVTERVVGALQGAHKAGVGAEAFVASFRAMLASMGDTPPAWLTEDVVGRALERLRRLLGAWRATPFGQTLELRFPVPRGD